MTDEELNEALGGMNVLTTARRRIAHGFIKGDYACDAAGARGWGPAANQVAWSITGATMVGRDIGEEEHMLRAQRALCEVLEIKDTPTKATDLKSPLAQWNDAPERTQVDALKAIDMAFAHLVTKVARTAKLDRVIFTMVNQHAGSPADDETCASLGRKLMAAKALDEGWHDLVRQRDALKERTRVAEAKFAQIGDLAYEIAKQVDGNRPIPATNFAMTVASLDAATQALKECFNAATGEGILNRPLNGLPQRVRDVVNEIRRRAVAAERRLAEIEARPNLPPIAFGADQ
jgi:hypothetical protein